MSPCIGHVSVVVRDYDEAIAYYTGALGFTRVEDKVLSDSKRWVLVAPRAFPGGTPMRILRKGGRV